MRYVKLLLPIIIMLIVLGSFRYVYLQEQKITEKGETTYELSYRYYFINDGPLNLTSVSIRLALLKNWEPYQVVSSLKVHTTPNRTTEDEYGNKFAWYEYTDFKVGEEIDLWFNATVILKFTDYSGTATNLITYDKTDPLYQLYTRFDPLSDDTDPRVIDVSEKISNKVDNTIDLAFEAYNFTSNYLRYKLLSEPRGAGFAISNGYGDCDEYTNLFIALLRSLGIPAIGHTAWLGEFIPGTAQTDNGAFSHAFPTFYLPNIGMISADPTRGASSIFDNWAKTDDKRITLTQGPDHPYRYLNYKWIPVEDLPNPTIRNNYTIAVYSSNTQYHSLIRTIIQSQIVLFPIAFIMINIINSRKSQREQKEKLDKILNPIKD